LNPLREARLRADMSQETLQQHTGIVQSRISKYELNKQRMTEPTAWALAGALEIPVEDLAPIIGNTGPRGPWKRKEVV
jgi:transcriptional regulator with XRE-family HTH domain